MADHRKIDDLKPGPIRHQKLPPALVARIEAIRSALDEVYPQSMAEWLDGFKRDANPEAQVVWWERLAHCYTEYTRIQDINPEQRRSSFRAIMGLALGSTDAVREDLANLPHTALDDIREILTRKKQ
jgi:hypothetical protein